jgi:hypothetical protein
MGTLTGAESTTRRSPRRGFARPISVFAAARLAAHDDVHVPFIWAPPPVLSASWSQP